MAMSVFRRAVSATLFLFVFTFGATSLFAQATGGIRGTVYDPSESVVQGATVASKSNETGLTRTTETNEDGIFVFADLPIGTYSVQVSKQGFETEQREEISLLTGQLLDLKVSLSLGSASQTVVVNAGAPLVQAASSSVQTSIDEKQMQDLPLNGRNPLQLTTLTPGTAITDTGTESGQQDNRGLTVNGLRATQNNFQLDGAIYTDRFFDSVPVLPSPDALQEFTIQSADYSAEYGGAGALVQLSTRSGSNEIHGSAFEFLRNTDLDAKNYFQTKVPPFKLNQFGGTIGGPIIKDKTFFFFSAQDLEQRSSPNPISIQIPTTAELSGNFSALLPTTVIYNPATGLPYPGNIITTPISSLSKAVANAFLVPLESSASSTGVFNSVANQNIDDTQYLSKIDHVFSQNNHLSGRYFYDQDNFQRPFNAPLGFYAENLFRNQSVDIDDTEIFSPTLTAHFSVNAGRFARTQIPEAPGLQSLQDLGQNLPLGTNVPIFPGIRANISGFVDIFSGGALKQDSTSFYYKASAVKIQGAHTISFGGDFERTRINANDYSYTPGDNTFNGQRTAAPTGAVLPSGATKSGSALADFYLGLDSTFFQDNGRTFYLREIRPSLFVQDDWKVSRQFTLNIGLRWDPWVPPIDLNQSLVGFTPGQQSTVAPNAPLGLVFQGDPGVSDSVWHNNWKDFAPRIGFAWNVGGNGKTVVRAAYGIFYGFPEGLLYQRTDATQPRDLYLNIPNPPAWDNIYAGYPGGDPFPRGHVPLSQYATYNFLLPVSGGALDPSSKVEYTQNWNLTLEDQLSKNLAVSIAYVGSHSIHIMGSRQFNPAVYGPGATVGNENSRRLYPGLGAVELASSYEYAYYDGLQINVTRRVGNGLTLLSNFTYSKSIDNTSSATEGNTGPPNPFNLNSSRGPSDFDQALRFNLSAVYSLPHFDLSGVENILLNGWQVNAIVSANSGFPFTILSGTDRSLSGIGNDYADQIGNPARPAGVSQIQEYFNTAAFTAATIGTFGDVSRNSLWGPGYADVDSSIFKNFVLTERFHLQFRAEAFNTLNRANFANPVSTFSSGTFGQITGTVTGNPGSPRVLQFALKLLF
jgi:hypothetical protein